ncbi:MAG: transcription termination/antitermination protein NusG [Planctomycetota bacterium]|nr:transcription termination/antitermination protein NusG [Planctomycetota bacterium]
MTDQSNNPIEQPPEQSQNEAAPQDEAALQDEATLERVDVESIDMENNPVEDANLPQADAEQGNDAPVSEYPVSENDSTQESESEVVAAEYSESEDSESEDSESEDSEPEDSEPEDSEPEDSEPEDAVEQKQWYILKVQSNREDSIREGLQRRVAIAGLDQYFGDIIVPIEKVTEVKGGKKRIVKRKLYPGYLVVQMEINEDTWFLVRETPGIGDFTGAAGKPTPMMPHEVARIVSTQEEKTDQAPKLKIAFKLGDRVKINEGTFENIEGEVDTIDETSGRVTVMINIFGRSTPVELEYWQIEAL